MTAIRRIPPSYDPATGRASARDVLAALRDGGIPAVARSTPLELHRPVESPPRLETAMPVEGTDIAVRAVPGPSTVGFVAFLDGIQRSEVRAHFERVPLVHGAVAAAVRRRDGRRMRLWDTPTRSHACYLPAALLDTAFVDALATRCPVVDTLADREPGAALPQHPGDLTARALTAVQRAREHAERTLAEAWVRRGDGVLLMDGGISGSELVARSAKVAGAVKSHRTLYVAGEALPRILGLREGERTTAVALTSPRRTAVATWYLRLREPAERGPFFGLVRVEVAHEDSSSITARADEVSRWLLAERAPVALPDARWDVMVYGIRECEQYLTAILQ